MRHPKDTQKMTQKTNCSQNIIFQRAPSGGDILGTVFTQSEKVKWCNCPFLRAKSNYDYTHMQWAHEQIMMVQCTRCMNGMLSVIQVLTLLSAVKHQHPTHPPSGSGTPKVKIFEKNQGPLLLQISQKLVDTLPLREGWG